MSLNSWEQGTKNQKAFRVQSQIKLLKDNLLLINWLQSITLRYSVFRRPSCFFVLQNTPDYCLCVVWVIAQKEVVWEQNFYYRTTHRGVTVFSVLCLYTLFSTAFTFQDMVLHQCHFLWPLLSFGISWVYSIGNLKTCSTIYRKFISNNDDKHCITNNHENKPCRCWPKPLCILTCLSLTTTRCGYYYSHFRDEITNRKVKKLSVS